METNFSEEHHHKKAIQDLCEEHPEYLDLIHVSYYLLLHTSTPSATIHRKIKQQIQKWS